MKKFFRKEKVHIILEELSILFLAISFSSFLVFFLFKYSKPLLATNVLTNPSFTGGSTGWTLSTDMAYYSSPYQDSAGSVGVYKTGRNASGSGTATQTLSSTIEAGSQVNLSFYWKKNCDIDPLQTGDEVCTTNGIYVRVKYGSSTYYEWSDTTTNMTDWINVDNDISSYITDTGTYTFEIYITVKSGNGKNAYAGGYIDNINLDVTAPTVTVGTTGTQISGVEQGDSNVYIGGAFTFVRNTGSTSVTSITINETGTISDTNISGLILYYKQEATCSTSIPGDATQFNSTPGSFSSGSSTVTGSMTVGTSQICMYVEVDIGSGAQVDDTVEIQITNPSTDVGVYAGVVSPNTAVAISGTTYVTGFSNSAPSFTNFVEDGPVNPGSTVTFTATASDTDGDNVFMVVCKTAGVTGTACDGGASDTWCTSTSVLTNPSCQYTTPSVYPDGIYNVYPYVFDEYDEPSTDVYQGAEHSFEVNNIAPVVSSVTINGGTVINLEAGTTKAVTLTASVTDNNSCDGGEIASVLGYVYRSGITYTGCDTAGEANNNYCYPEISCTVDTGTCTGPTDGSADYTCTVNLQYYADPTDTGTQYPDDTWLTTIKAVDDDTASNALEVSQGVELNSLVAFNISTTVNYGELNVNEKNDPLDRTTVITPTGNVGLYHEVSGPANMCTDFPTCGGGTIPVGNQKYALNASTAYASGTSLTTSAVEVYTNVPKPTTGSPTTKSIWWGILVPPNTSPGSYNGNISVTGLKNNIIYW